VTRLQLSIDFRLSDASPMSRAELFRQAVEICAWADRLGFFTVTLAEHHGTPDGTLPTPELMAAVIAARTTSLGLQPIILAPLHEPLHLAESLAIADIVSDGRVSPVIAAGYAQDEFDMFGVELSDRGRAVEETVRTLRAAWSGEEFEHRGRQVRVTPVPDDVGGPLITLGGTSRAALNRAVRMADKYLPTGPGGFWKKYAAMCEEVGRDPGDREYSTPSFLYVTDDPDRSWAEVGPYVQHQAAAYSRGAGAWGTFPSIDGPDGLAASGMYKVITPDECVELAQRLHPNGGLLFWPLMGGLPTDLAWQSLDLFERAVLPRITVTPPPDADARRATRARREPLWR
jgi:alkanesulfonate monooxygenase SsuD/methylene tetrahydromethanopterin reductase-like flavin-dependent oxidoreductase (luciferase family)